jgi:hypothetical protein
MKDYTLLAMELFKIKRQIIISLYHTFKDKVDANEFNNIKMQLRKDLEVLKLELFDKVHLSEVDLKQLKRVNHKITVKVIMLKKEVEKLTIHYRSFSV